MDDSVGCHFVCESCAESMEVDGPMRDALIEFGCVICGSPVSARSFDPQ